MREINDTFTHNKYRFRKLTDRAIPWILGSCAVLVLLPMICIFSYVLSQGYSSLNLSFFTELPKPVGEIGGGMANSLVGTAILALLASFLGIPFGIFTGIYLSEYGRSSTSGKIVRFSSELLASTPSIIIGLFVYALLVIPMKRFSALAGGVALGILMIPIIARSTEEILKTVPDTIREAGLALGLPRWRVIMQIVLTSHSKAITTVIMLSLARIAGETSPLLFTAFSNRFWHRGLDEPISSLPVQIYSYSISPYNEWHNQAWAGALVLILFIFLLNLSTRWFISLQESSKK